MEFSDRHDVQQYLTSQAKTGAIVELGCGYGNGVIAMNKGNVNRLPIFSIDPYYDYTDRLGGEYGPTTKAAMRENTRGINFTLIQRPALSAVKVWTLDIGLLWLDLSMDYPSLRQIFDSWVTFVIPGGYIGITGLEYPQLGTEQVMEDAIKDGFVRELPEQRFVAVLRKNGIIIVIKEVVK